MSDVIDPSSERPKSIDNGNGNTNSAYLTLLSAFIDVKIEEQISEQVRIGQINISNMFDWDVAFSCEPYKCGGDMCGEARSRSCATTTVI